MQTLLALAPLQDWRSMAQPAAPTRAPAMVEIVGPDGTSHLFPADPSETLRSLMTKIATKTE